MKHFEYLAEPCKDPRRELLVNLLETIQGNSCIITYTDFETIIFRNFMEWFPEYKEQINNLIGNIRDLSVPFEKMYYYHWQMNGSYSIKEILPILVPEMTYKNMPINNGGMAMDAYFAICHSNDQEQIYETRRNLLEYCKLDTLAMVRILERVKRMV